ncbi:MAG: murein biosynthesis integral membrane protein MurJ [Thermoflexales bacterium]|nr:murein biosynthesis integral membrane protein MurJ [Thermoflexales bacterium]
MRSAEGDSLLGVPPEMPIQPRLSIARAATLTSFGNLSSRIVGLGREMVKSFYFGNGQAASAFELAANIPTQFYDLLVGGMLSSALVPTFSAMADPRRDGLRAFGELLGALIGLAFALLSALIALLWLAALPIARVIIGGPNQDAEMVAALLRITIPAILFLNLSGILTSALHARGKFGFTAFTATTYNLVMIVCVVLLEPALGAQALAIGLLSGSIAQVLIQLPGLRGVPLRLSLNWRLPGVAQVIRLFLPVAGGLALAQIAVQVSFILASRISAEGPATMRYAAQVIQFPLGMVVTAVAAAILPALSAVHGEDFKRTLAQGLRLVCVLMVPASVGLYVLASPVVALLFERGAFTAESTAYTASALRAAIPGLLFAAIDIPLIYAFYAQRDTRTPTLVGIFSTLFYFALVGGQLLLEAYASRPFTLEDLILANSLKTGCDAALMGILLRRRIQGLSGYGIGSLLVKVVGASLVMAGVAWLVMTETVQRFAVATFVNHLAAVVLPAGLGAATYLAIARSLGIAEVLHLQRVVAQRLFSR